MQLRWEHLVPLFVESVSNNRKTSGILRDYSVSVYLIDRWRPHPRTYHARNFIRWPWCVCLLIICVSDAELHTIDCRPPHPCTHYEFVDLLIHEWHAELHTTDTMERLLTLSMCLSRGDYGASNLIRCFARRVLNFAPFPVLPPCRLTLLLHPPLVSRLQNLLSRNSVKKRLNI